ncbi:MAG: hypothetical protein GXO36_02235 [Chloroflexi bacterium]|nr:hypothetical protein [Chloroflexota bacterium]
MGAGTKASIVAGLLIAWLTWSLSSFWGARGGETSGGGAGGTWGVSDQAAADAHEALERWFQALRAGDCAALVEGLARSSPLWEGRAALELACEQGEGGAWAQWRAARVGPIVDARSDRVVFRLEGVGDDAYAVMVLEDGVWRYAGDVFTAWSPRPGVCEREGLQVLWGPVWDRATGVSVGLTLKNEGEGTRTWQAPCATLEWADGQTASAATCPEVVLGPGDVWRGELFFPKPAEQQGHPWAARPQRVQLTNLRQGDQTVSLRCTWRTSTP